jgi:hypothetical protein
MSIITIRERRSAGGSCAKRWGGERRRELNQAIETGAKGPRGSLPRRWAAARTPHMI